ncbi:MAG: hypothetical protein MUP22_07410 [Desulfobacterales bacterium]|nr:hypothetical protein [Desulfobacterales bacterium]
MLTPIEKEAIDKGLIVQWIIWTAMLISLFFYVLICHLAGDQIRQNTNPDFPLELFRRILYVVAIIEIFIAYFLRKFMLNVRIGHISLMSLNSSLSSNQPAFMGRYTVAMLIALAISESIGIYGMILYFLGDSFNTLYTFIGVAAISMFFYRPKKEEIVLLANDMKVKLSQSQKT